MKRSIITREKVLETIEQLCTKIGISADHTKIIADALVSANLRGVDTHGIRCFVNYANRWECGSLNPNPNIRTIKESGISGVLDGDNGLGHVIGTKSMEMAIEKAKKSGIGIVCARNSNHFGSAAYFAMKAADQNLIGVSMTNASARLAPTGGITPCYGNNPWSVAVPSTTIPIVVDMAISVVANSRLIIAREQGKEIPLGWALTKDGEPTQDPNVAELLLPIGGYKGYAIALVVEVLAGILSGASFGKEVGVYNSLDGGQDVGHFFVALDIEYFMPIDEFNERLNKFIEEIKKSQLAKGTDSIYLPGEKEYLEYKKRLKSGIPIDEDVVNSINKLADKYRVQPLL